MVEKSIAQERRRAVQSLARAKEAYDDANPDVGMGFPFSYFEDQAMLSEA